MVIQTVRPLARAFPVVLLAFRRLQRSVSRVPFVASLLAVLSCGPAVAADQQFITIGTAGVTGVYYPAGGAACRVINQTRSEHGVRCSVEATLGSISNLEQIRAGNIEFGYVQSDWQHHAYKGTSVFREAGPFSDLRSVFSLHLEVATIVVRENSGFRSIEDLKGARISAGRPGSGSEASWRVLTQHLGWTEEALKSVSVKRASGLADALCSGAIDAYFVLVGHPAALIEESAEQCGISLLGLEQETLESFLAHTPYYKAAEVSDGLYGQTNSINSFGVVATVVTSAAMPDDVVYTLVKEVHRNFDSFTSLHPAFSQLQTKDLMGYDMPAPLHAGAQRFFREAGLIDQ